MHVSAPGATSASKPIRCVRLTRGIQADQPISRFGAWEEFLERVVHRSIRSLWVSSTMDQPQVEGIAFIQALVAEAHHAATRSGHESPEIALFRKPIAFVSFHLRDRRYMCSIHPDVRPTEQAGQPSETFARSVHRVCRGLAKTSDGLDERPRIEELAFTLVRQVEETLGGRASLAEGSCRKTVEVHPAIRGAIQNWQLRHETMLRRLHGHRQGESGFFGYPVLDGLVPEARTLLLLLMSPLDGNFVDEKVPEDHRIAQIALGLFDVADALFPGGLRPVVREIRAAFAQVLFTAMLNRSSRALSDTFEEQSCIARYWMRIASDGLHGVLGEGLRTNPFDPFGFCEAIVRKVLCADIPGVENTELFPFDRVFIFREAGTSSRFRVDQPVEVRVLEASILSNNPADRAGYLTRRERRLRGTEDFECDASKKRISDEDVFHFYIHGTDKGLFLSMRPEPPDHDNIGSRSSGVSPSEKYYMIGKPVVSYGNDISEFIYNLIGRILPETRGVKEIVDPSDPSRCFCRTNTFNEEFEKQRQMVLQRADDAGLFYHYEHGVDLEREIPVLMQLQNAYAAYLSDHFRARDEQFLRDSYRRHNVSDPDIERLLAMHKQVAREGAGPGSASTSRHGLLTQGQRGRAKIVLIAFSWDLHDENMRMSSQQEGLDGSDPILGDDYCFTMILVADQDKEKSMARLQSEREDLRLFFQMLMRQIWMDRRKEYEYLDKKSRAIANSLFQFTHRVKGLLPRAEDRKEIDLFYDRLSDLIRPMRTPVREEYVSSGLGVVARLISLEPDQCGEKDLERCLRGIMSRWGTLRSVDPDRVSLRVLPSPIPNLRVLWCAPVVNDAFHVVFKNACEAAFGQDAGDASAIVEVQVQAVPRGAERSTWFLDVVVRNTGGPISESLLRRLNAPAPDPLDRNPRKEGSTGFGIYLARYQLHQVIGQGADVRVENVDEDRVETRIRLPARLVPGATPERADISAELELPPGPYVLYVEDDLAVYGPGLEVLGAVASRCGLSVVHCRGCQRALAMVRTRAPRAVIADLNIPLEEQGHALPRTKYGVALVRGVAQTGAERGERPPIWVLTGEEEGWAREKLGDLTTLGYRFLPAPEGPAGEASEPGVVVVFSGQKRPETLEALGRWLRRAPTIVPGDVGQEAAWIELPFADLEMGNRLQDALREGALAGRMVLIMCPEAGGEELVGYLTAWFQHPGVQDPESLIIGDQGTYRLTEHGYHQGLVLVIPLKRDVWRKVPLGVAYWALQQNVWLGSTPLDPAVVAKAWPLLRHEGRGPLSTIRHDLHNSWSSEVLAPVLREVVMAIGRAEDLLSLPDSLRRWLHAALVGGKGEARLWERIAASWGEASQETRQELFRVFGEVERVLVRGATKVPEVEEATRRKMVALDQLRRYLGGAA